MNQLETGLMTKTGSDIFQTPGYAFEYIAPHIPVGAIIWESACGSGMLSRTIKSMGWEIVESDIKQGDNFFEYQPDLWDIQITNPPFSVKDKWLERSYQLKKPFALLMPVTALHSIKRCNLFRRHGIGLVVPPKRINFITPSAGKSSAWFPTMWFCWGIDLPEQIVFAPSLDTQGKRD